MVGLEQAIPGQVHLAPGEGRAIGGEVYLHAAGSATSSPDSRGRSAPEIAAQMKTFETAPRTGENPEALDDSFAWFGNAVKGADTA
jgi:hypothetical protein